MAFPKPKLTRLSNGLRVLVIPMKNSPTVTVEVLVEAGSHYEDARVNGISHFLEHLCFKGTSKRPDAHAIAHELESIGAENNAFTSEEYTGYWAKARSKHLKKIFDIVADLYLDPKLPAPEIEKEKGVIIEEINMYEDLPQRRVHEVLDELMYGDQPAGRTILGPKDTIRGMTREDVVAYRKAHYVAPKTVVVIAGDVTPAEGLALAKRSFGSLPKAPAPKKPSIVERQHGPQIVLKHKTTEQSHFVLGFRGYRLSDKRSTAARVLGAVLGGGMSSRLFQKLREEMGVCYYVGSGHHGSRDIGQFKIRAGVDTKRLDEVVGVILDEVRRLTNERVPDKELAKAQESIIGHIEMGLETSDALADWYGGDEILHLKLETPEVVCAKIRAVTAADVQRVARDLFVDDKMNLAVIGPTRDATRLAKLLKL